MGIVEAVGSPQPLKLTIDDYLLLGRAGSLAEHAKTELIDGAILIMNAAYSRHARAQRALYDALSATCRVADLGVEILFEVSVAIPPDNMPQPDLVVARDVPDNAPLPASSVMLVIEIGDASTDFDLDAKRSLYAKAAIEEYWVIDLPGGSIHQMWQPRDGRYAEYRRQSIGDLLTATCLPIELQLPTL